MAFEQYCLEKSAFDEPFFYLWRNAPSVIIGLNQSAFTEVNLGYLKENGIVLARRLTGGGAVYHDLQNLNYSFVLPRGSLCNPVGMIAAALRSMGVPADISGRNDILVYGHKCSGFAKRLWKDRVLIHGTLMFNVDIQILINALSAQGSKLSSKGVDSVRSRVANLKDFLPSGTTIDSFKAGLEDILSGGDGKIMLEEASWAEINDLADKRFRREEWIYGRSPLSGIVREKHFNCGNIRAEISVSHGIIKDIRFTGDFIGDKEVSGFERKISSLRFCEDALYEAVNPVINEYFDGVSASEFVSFLLG